jgi:hypothetical protein
MMPSGAIPAQSLERRAQARKPNQLDLSESESMSGIQFVTDDKGRTVGVLIDLKKHGAVCEDFWDGLVSESRRKETAIPYEQYRAGRRDVYERD